MRCHCATDTLLIANLASGGARTRGPTIKSRMLYQLSYGGKNICGSPTGNRTLATRVKGADPDH